MSFGLTQSVDKNGDGRDTNQFDIARIKVLKKRRVKIVASPTGGPVGGGTSKPVR